MSRSALGLAATFYLAAPLLTASAVHADPFLPVPPASFLNYHVDTVHQLTEQVQLDGTVRARLARYFHMSEPHITSYIQNNLILARLPETGRYRVACVTSSGREFWVSENLPAGTPVFALRGTNQPILRLVCGNPLVKTLPAVQQAAPVRPAELIKTPAHSTATPAVVPAAPKTVAFAPTGTLAGPGPAALGPLVRVAGTSQKAGGHGSFLPILGAGLIPFLPHGGGHGSTPSKPTTPITPTTPTKPTPPTPPTTPTKPKPPVTPPGSAPVPEPSPVLFFGMAGAGLALLRARRRAR